MNSEFIWLMVWEVEECGAGIWCRPAICVIHDGTKEGKSKLVISDN